MASKNLAGRYRRVESRRGLETRDKLIAEEDGRVDGSWFGRRASSRRRFI
jgi:hypothetical protein